MNRCYYDSFPSPVGPLLAAVDEDGAVIGVWFLPGGDADAALSRLASPAPDKQRTGSVRAQLLEYFSGRRRAFDLPLAPSGTEFQRRVWRELQKISFGKTRSYGEIAKSLGKPGAARAVGRAAGANPIPIIIPCHRCVGANGSLTGFAGGLEIKRRLLELEGIIPNPGKIARACGSVLAAPGAAAEIGAELERRGITVDVLVNNAGFGDLKPFAVADEETIRGMLQVNVVALAQLAKVMLPGMLARKSGRILNAGSTGSFAPTPGMAVYCATKAFVLSFSEALAEEVRGTGVTATALCPGNTVTGFARTAGSEGAFLERVCRMTAAAVARTGFRAAVRGRRLVVPGIFNKLLVAAIQFAPRGLLVKSSKLMMSK